MRLNGILACFNIEIIFIFLTKKYIWTLRNMSHFYRVAFTPLLLRNKTISFSTIMMVVIYLTPTIC